jgi:ankyrin repeat protein
VVEALVEEGADIKAPTFGGWTPFHLAAKYGHESLRPRLRELLKRVPVTTRRDVVVPSEFVDPELLLAKASREGDLGAIEHLLTDVGADVSAADSNGMTALQFAAGRGHLVAVERLLAAGALATVANVDEISPLHVAALSGHTEVLIKLIDDAGAVVSTTDMDGISPLHLASMECHHEAVEALLSRGGDACATELQRGETPLHFAALSGHRPAAKAVVEALLRNGADSQAQNKDGRTPAYLARQRNHTALADIIDGLLPDSELHSEAGGARPPEAEGAASPVKGLQATAKARAAPAVGLSVAAPPALMPPTTPPLPADHSHGGGRGRGRGRGRGAPPQQAPTAQLPPQVQHRTAAPKQPAFNPTEVRPPAAGPSSGVGRGRGRGRGRGGGASSAPPPPPPPPSPPPPPPHTKEPQPQTELAYGLATLWLERRREDGTTAGAASASTVAAGGAAATPTTAARDPSATGGGSPATVSGGAKGAADAKGSMRKTGQGSGAKKKGKTESTPPAPGQGPIGRGGGRAGGMAGGGRRGGRGGK